MQYDQTITTTAGIIVRVHRADADSPTNLTRESAELDGADVVRFQTMLEEAEETT